MTHTLPKAAGDSRLASVEPLDARAALDYEAPFVIEKLLKDHVADTADEAQELFAEVKRYLVLHEIDRTKTWKMYSLRVDEAWHEFVLFTYEYTAFCAKYFGRYLHHSPSNAPDSGFGHRAPEASMGEFADRYREAFGRQLPDLWVDSSSVTLDRRVRNDYRGRLAVVSAGNATVDLLGPNGQVLLNVSDIAAKALRLIAATGAFYVRELPGDLTEVEKVGLISALVDTRLLRVS
jgi:hypothetical protein